MDEQLSLEPLPWAGRGVTADEWFFITTLYVPMNLKGQRTLIREYFPIFANEAGGDTRRISPELVAGWAPRFPWVRQRLCKMASVLRGQGLSMEEYRAKLQRLDQCSSFDDPAPALDAIIHDHQATGWKTLSCFVRDCVQGDCFPIDTRVHRVLDYYGLLPPSNGWQLEWQLVNLCRSIGRNPRQIARLFYAAADKT